MTPDREAEEQARRLAAKVEDCRDRPEQTAREFLELEEDRDYWRTLCAPTPMPKGAES